MTRVIELADDPDLSGWTELTEVKRETLRCGGIANKTEVGASSGFDWYDDAGTRSLPGRRPIRILETATTPDTTLFYGRVSTKGLGRGIRVTDDSKELDVGLDDRNADLQGIIVDGWVRPAETDVARVNALLAAFLSGTSSTSPRARASTDLADTYVAATPTVSLPAQTYTDSSPGRVLQDIVSVTGKECFVTVDGELFYDAPTSTAYASTYSITDDFPNTADELLPIWDGDAATEDPSELLSGARAKYGTNGSFVSESRSGVVMSFDKWEDTVHLQTTSAARAALELDTLLDNQGIEEKSRRCAVLIPEDQVDRIKWGQTISFRAAAAGDLTPVTLRISYLLWEVPLAPGAPYVAHLELSKPKKIAPRIKKGTAAQTQPPTPSVFVQDCDSPLFRETFTRTVAAGGWGPSEFGFGAWTVISNGAVASVNGSEGLLQPVGTGAPGSSVQSREQASILLTYPIHMRTRFKIAGPFGGALSFILGKPGFGEFEVNMDYSTIGLFPFTFSAVMTSDSGAEIEDALGMHPFGDIDVAGMWLWIELIATTNSLDIRAYLDGDTPPAYTELSFGTVVTLPDYLQVVAFSDEGAGDVADWHVDLIEFLECTEPYLGQPVDTLIGTGDGATTLYTTPYPYQPGSLKVYANPIREFDITETDPVAGTFTFGTAPFDPEEIRAEFVRG